jgi:hypothetical protein
MTHERLSENGIVPRPAIATAKAAKETDTIRRRAARASWLLLLLGAPLLCAPAFAQEGKGEVTGFGGGIWISGGGGTQALFGASGGARVTDNVRVFGEFSFLSLGSASVSVDGLNASGSDRLYNFGGGVDYSFGSSKIAVPYVLGVVGVGHERVSSSASGGGVSASFSLNGNDVYLGPGGGIRIYAGHNWGFKPEFRYERYVNSGGSSNTAVFTVGFFYQFAK